MKPLTISKPLAAPIIGVDYVVEIVGPNPVPSEASRALLTPAWQDPLGRPRVWGMGMMDQVWRPVYANETVSLDSLALTWRIWSAERPMTRQGAETVLRGAEAFANQIGRRAMPMPTPDQLDRRAAEIAQIRENLDIGFNLDLVPTGGSFEGARVRQMALAEGWRETPDGFEWRQNDWPSELAGMFIQGSLNGRVEDIAMGFRVATSPAPLEIAEQLTKLATRWAAELGGVILDEEGGIFDAGSARNDLVEATKSLQINGVTAGSAAALAVFEG